MYSALQGSEEVVTTAVCQPYINEMQKMDLLPEVIAEYESRKLPSPRVERYWRAIIQFSGAHFEKRQEIAMTPNSWNLAKAMQIIPTYKVVRDFANDFAFKTLRHRPATVHGHQPEPNELGRIMRTFYRFQIFCNMFPKPHLIDVWGWSDGDVSLQKSLVLDKYAPHENEQ